MKPALPDLNLLRVFDAVMSERNLTRAAETLSLTCDLSNSPTRPSTSPSCTSRSIPSSTGEAP